MGAIVGQSPWWHYPLGFIAAFLIMYMSSIAYTQITGKIGAGGGAIKLATVIGGALGLLPALQFAIASLVIIILLVSISSFLNNIEIPSSPVFLLTLLAVLAYQNRAVLTG